MRKTLTLFDRDWNGNRGVVPALIVHPGGATPTEKVNGTNVRVTVRKQDSLAVAVRLEKRRNPSKEQKRAGITEPWYVDADSNDPSDQFVFEAVHNTSLIDLPEGEWSAEAVGPKIQGNPLGLEDHRLFFFDLGRLPTEACVPRLDSVPTLAYPANQSSVEAFYDDLSEYVHMAKSRINPEVGIEGIVWHGESWAKIKVVDFKGIRADLNAPQDLVSAAEGSS